jgi:hypothetical protein
VDDAEEEEDDDNDNEENPSIENPHKEDFKITSKAHVDQLPAFLEYPSMAWSSF